MIPVNLENLPNNNNWRVVHDPDNNMFYLKNDNGNRRPGYFTSRYIAEHELYHYLKNIHDEALAAEARKKEAAKPKHGGFQPGVPQKKVLVPGKNRPNKGPHGNSKAAKEAKAKAENN
jgi:hypothetical protein